MIIFNKKILSLCMATMLGIAGCGAAGREEGKDPVQEPIEEQNVPDYQGMLNVLQPGVYSSVAELQLEPGTTISLIGREYDSDFWKEVRAGAEQAVADINEQMAYTGKDKVVLNYSAPEDANGVDEQINILDEELARYPAAVGIAVADSSACEVQFDLAAENGIPIVVFDSGSDFKNTVCTVDTNNYEAAVTAADKLADSLEDSGKVLAFIHDSKSTTAKERESGFLDTMKDRHPDIVISAVHHMDETICLDEESVKAVEEGTEKAEGENDTQEVISKLIEANPDVKGIYITNEGTAKSVLQVLEQMEKEGKPVSEIKIISFDGGQEQLEKLQDEKLEGLIVQNPFGIGYATVVACGRAILELGNEAVVDAGYTWVTKGNLSEEAIQKMMY